MRISMSETFEFMKRNRWNLLLVAILLTSLAINLNVSLTEPLVFGDEGFYAARGQGIAQSLSIDNLGMGMYGEDKIPGNEHSKKTPMTFLSLSSFYMIAGKMGMRAFMPIVSILSAFLLFLLTRKLYSTKAGIFATVFYLAAPALITHTIFLYTEQLSLMFLIASVYFLYNYLEREEWLYLTMAGLMFGFSALTEPTALAFSVVFAAVLYLYKKGITPWIKELGTIAVLTLVL
ncbi:MAG: ArnT family glycosyltransferase, partial [Candidatus Aenigmatarchaeota archaeon]